MRNKGIGSEYLAHLCPQVVYLFEMVHIFVFIGKVVLHVRLLKRQQFIFNLIELLRKAVKFELWKDVGLIWMMNTFVQHFLPSGLAAHLEIKHERLLFLVFFVRETLKLIKQSQCLSSINDLIVNLVSLRTLLLDLTITAFLVPLLVGIVYFVHSLVFCDRGALLILLIKISLIRQHGHITCEHFHVVLHLHDNLALRRWWPRLLGLLGFLF